MKQLDEDENLIGVHDELMRNYGYISLDEFKKMPIPTVLELLDQIRKYKERLKRSLRKR
jgi:hypothetical protein